MVKAEEIINFKDLFVKYRKIHNKRQDRILFRLNKLDDITYKVSEDIVEKNISYIAKCILEKNKKFKIGKTQLPERLSKLFVSSDDYIQERDYRCKTKHRIFFLKLSDSDKLAYSPIFGSEFFDYVKTVIVTIEEFKYYFEEELNKRNTEAIYAWKGSLPFFKYNSDDIKKKECITEITTHISPNYSRWTYRFIARTNKSDTIELKSNYLFSLLDDNVFKTYMSVIDKVQDYDDKLKERIQQCYTKIMQITEQFKYTKYLAVRGL